VKLDYQLPPRFVPSHQAIHLLQIAREALSNVLHARRPRNGTVSQRQSGKLTVHDNGRGVPENAERTTTMV
jgi:two-component system nitrate/nitrite sensor histidine kinase NarX